MSRLIVSIAAIMILFAPISAPCPVPILDLDTIRPVLCGKYVGTGEIIAPDIIMTAAHVVGKSQVCQDRVHMIPGKLMLISQSQDIAILKFPHDSLPDVTMEYSCDGFTPNSTYVAYGWAHGEDFLGNLVVATDEHYILTDEDSMITLYGLAHLKGLIIQGMSGGPIADIAGVMHGMNSMTQYPKRFDRAFSRELHDTFMCGVYPEDLKKGTA